MRYLREIFSVPGCSRLVKPSSNESPQRIHAALYFRQKGHFSRTLICNVTYELFKIFLCLIKVCFKSTLGKIIIYCEF